MDSSDIGSKTRTACPADTAAHRFKQQLDGNGTGLGHEADPDDVDTIKGNLPNAAAAIKKQLGGRVSVRVVLYDSKGRLITSATK